MQENHIINFIPDLRERFDFLMDMYFPSVYQPITKFLGQLLNIWIAEGQELSTGKTISVLCVVDKIVNKNYIFGLVYGTLFHDRNAGRIWAWDIPKLINKEKGNYDLLFVLVPDNHQLFCKLNNCFYIPTWVKGEVDIPINPKVMKSNSVKSDLAKIKKNNLLFEITRDTKLFDNFYYNMFVPYIRSTHGTKADVDGYVRLRSKFASNAELLLVKKQDEYIAGTMIWYRERIPEIYRIGILNGNREYIRDRVVRIMDHFSFEHLERKGFSEVNFGWSRPFLHDGVLNYKRAWHQKLVGPTEANKFAIMVMSDTIPTKGFLKNNPFIFESNGFLNGAVFVDNEELLSSEELMQMHKDYFHVGLSKLFIYCHQPDDSAKKTAIPPEISEHIELCSIDEFFKNTMPEGSVSRIEKNYIAKEPLAKNTNE